ncbi:BRAP2 RING ZnF UBP domain-containing protein 2 [Beta vulgaris subsp. vulgaris]|uniref:BRAP2 RING ZnF UBP domain-containing protein 2 n=1 Tax=Beta vulgaris subsp. vulgaris TaxID=3555 RepID=UPI002546DB08|nr:BRAP2 RING ZnF UBP domain-containing protein 2 [Beta vulgaris subsp. vulgaris]
MSETTAAASASKSPVADSSENNSISSPSSAMVSGDLSLLFSTQTLAFSSGNPRIEETCGVMHFYSNDVVSSFFFLLFLSPRKALVCVLGVPNHMTYADFCRFCGSFVQHMLEMRIVRDDETADRYIALIRFDSQDSADGFFKHFNGKRFSSLEPEACHVLFIIDVQYTGSIEHGQASLMNSTEQSTCPVCLERLDQETSGILTTICNHSFHSSCISRWTDSSCPVCRYCQQQPEKSTCFICQTSENLWICVICGFVGCGRYKEGHAIVHWKETQHCYSLDLETRRVWDYVGDNYVHRLIQSKTDGKLVELNAPCSHAVHGCGSCECSEDPGINDAILNSKVEAIVNEYNELLSTQLENQKLYFESLLQEVKEETEREIAEAVEKAVSLKLQKLQAKLDRCIKEKKFLDDINENLLKNQEIWKAKLQETEEREEKAVRLKDTKLQDLEEQLKDLMLQLEAGQAVEQLSINEVSDGAVLKLGGESSTTTTTKSKNRKKR